MSEYNTFAFDSIQCEDGNAVSEAEYNEVMQLMADSSASFEGYAEWSEQVEEKEPVKDWLRGYSNRQTGPTSNGIAI
jgi:hypothetical protein